VAAVHRLEDAVASRLHRQVEVRHQFGDLAVRCDQGVGHVGGVARGVANALQPIDLRERPDELGETALAVGPGIHVLPQKHDLAGARIDQRMRLGEDVAPRPRDLGPAGIGDDAVGAELVAAFLHGQERARGRAAARRKRGELADGRHVRVDRMAAAA